jgi:hypothetical protein
VSIIDKQRALQHNGIAEEGMPMFHKDFCWGKGLWIWRLKDCLNGDVEAIIKKCRDYDISYLIIKSGNGANIWTQFTSDLIQKLHGAGIKVYSWSYVYGDEPLKEAQVAMHSLSLGVDGHVFDAESEYEHLQNNSAAAELMLKTVRAKYPDAFLAHAPYPIIDYHTAFPYVTFGKYCDAVMPQIYYGTMKKTPQQAILAMYDNFVRWQKNWIESGHSDSVKPIVPLAQSYDNRNISPPYILTPADILSFVSIVKGYKSVNFWSFQHIERDDCWEAIRDAQLDKPSDADRGIVAQEQPVAPAQTAPEAPAATQAEQPQTPPETTPEQQVEPEEVPVEQVETAPASPEVATPEEPVPSEPVQPAESTPAPIPHKLVNLKQTFDVPANKPTTIVLTPNDNHPDGMEVKVYTQKTHREYLVEFVRNLLALLQSKLLRR